MPRLSPGWAPFAWPLSVTSQRQAISIVHSMFEWLVHAGNFRANPWALVRRRMGDDAAAPNMSETSRAFTPTAWSALLAQADDEKEDPATAARMRFLLTFSEATGLGPAEMVNARRSHFTRRNGTWWLRVHGKGARNRVVPVPSTALQATIDLLAFRGVEWDTTDDVPVLASIENASKSLSYPALYKAFNASCAGRWPAQTYRRPPGGTRMQRRHIGYAIRMRRGQQNVASTLTYYKQTLDTQTLARQPDISLRSSIAAQLKWNGVRIGPASKLTSFFWTREQANHMTDCWIAGLVVRA